MFVEIPNKQPFIARPGNELAEKAKVSLAAGRRRIFILLKNKYFQRGRIFSGHVDGINMVIEIRAQDDSPLFFHTPERSDSSKAQFVCRISLWIQLAEAHFGFRYFFPIYIFLFYADVLVAFLFRTIFSPFAFQTENKRVTWSEKTYAASAYVICDERAFLIRRAPKWLIYVVRKKRRLMDILWIALRSLDKSKMNVIFVWTRSINIHFRCSLFWLLSSLKTYIYNFNPRLACISHRPIKNVSRGPIPLGYLPGSGIGRRPQDGSIPRPVWDLVFCSSRKTDRTWKSLRPAKVALQLFIAETLRPPFEELLEEALDNRVMGEISGKIPNSYKLRILIKIKK